MKINLLCSILCMFISVSCSENPNKGAKHIITLEQNDITRLVPRKGDLNGGIKSFTPEKVPFKNFWTTDWKTSDQSIVWHLKTDNSDYVVAAIVEVPGLADGDNVVLEVASSESVANITIKNSGWQRIWFSTPINFKKGDAIITVRITENVKNYEVRLFSLEVSTFETKKRIYEEAKMFRSDVTWMTDIPYGFFFHWNSKSMPQRGEQLSYEEAVNNFDVEKFAKTVNDCGGKLIFFTTSWAGYYFPAPIKAIDNILAGRTTKRDLIADLSDALSKYGIKIILYYHQGQDDKEWWNKQNFTPDNPGDLYVNIENILGEVSQRYGNKIAGFWIDDGMAYYPNNASFERIAKATKSGNKDNVICFNPWIFPKLTEFQDFFAGERDINIETAGLNNPYLPINGDGKYIDGPQSGLQATFSGLLEPGDWTHLDKNSDIPSPHFTVEELKLIVKESNKRKNLPMFNVRIYQDGTISDETFTLLKTLKQQL